MNRYGGLNIFITLRISETIFMALMQISKIIMLRGRKRERLCLIILISVQILLYIYATIFDFFNKWDAAGYSVLAQKKD